MVTATPLASSSVVSAVMPLKTFTPSPCAVSSRIWRSTGRWTPIAVFAPGHCGRCGPALRMRPVASRCETAVVSASNGVLTA